MVVIRGIEPRSSDYQSLALPLSYMTMVKGKIYSFSDIAFFSDSNRDLLRHTFDKVAIAFNLSIIGSEGWNLCFLTERFAVCITKYD